MNKALIGLISLLMIGCDGSSDSSSDSTSSSSGQGGSLASMVMLNGNLYAIDKDQIKRFDLSTPLMPTAANSEISTWVRAAETLFVYQGQYLMVGSELGIAIFEPSDTDNSLEFISSFTHIRAYDPVIAYEDKAYFTTRDGNANTRSSTDLVSILDLSDINNPTEIYTDFSLYEPKGLALHEQDLYVCDEKDGLIKYVLEETKFIDETLVDANGNPITQESSKQELIKFELSEYYPCIDIIITNNRMILTSAEGVTQLGIGVNGIVFLSKIPTN